MNNQYVVTVLDTVRGDRYDTARGLWDCYDEKVEHVVEAHEFAQQGDFLVFSTIAAGQVAAFPAGRVLHVKQQQEAETS